MAGSTWLEYYGAVQEQLRGYGREVAAMNRSGWASKNSLHSFASRLYDFNKRAVPQLLARCRELEAILEDALAMLEKRDQAIAALEDSRSHSWGDGENPSGDSLEQERLELEVKRLELEVEKARLEVERLKILGQESRGSVVHRDSPRSSSPLG